METSCIPTLAYSGADLLHGPSAMVGNVSPVIAVIAVIAVVPDDKGGEALQPVLDRLRGRGADLFVVGPAAQVEAAPAGFVPPTDGVPEELQPILEVLPLQLPAYEVTIARGQDPDAPKGAGEGDGDALTCDGAVIAAGGCDEGPARRSRNVAGGGFILHGFISMVAELNSSEAWTRQNGLVHN